MQRIQGQPGFLDMIMPLGTNLMWSVLYCT